jgi:hypothetical protein
MFPKMLPGRQRNTATIWLVLVSITSLRLHAGQRANERPGVKANI